MDAESRRTDFWRGTPPGSSVNRSQNMRYYDLIDAFGERTGVHVLLNTSFNENEPICTTPEQALDTFVRTKMTCLSWATWSRTDQTGSRDQLSARLFERSS